MTSDFSMIVEQLVSLASRVEEGFVARIMGLGNIRQELSDLHSYVEAKGFSVLKLGLSFILTAIATYLAMKVGRLAIGRLANGTHGWRKGLIVATAAFLAIVLMFGSTRIIIADTELRSILRVWILATTLALLARSSLPALFRVRRAHRTSVLKSSQGKFHGLVTFSICWALFGIAISTTLRTWQAGPGIRDLVGTFFVALPAMILLATAYWRHRLAVTIMLMEPRSPGRGRRRLAVSWPTIAITVIVLTFVSTQVNLILGRPLPGMPTLLTLLLFLIAPHLDTLLAQWAERGVEASNISVLSVAIRRTIRFAVVVTILILLGYMWVLPLFLAFGADTTEVTRRAFEITLIVLASAFLWNCIGATTSRIAHQEGHSGTAIELSGPRSRLGTLLPLLSGTAKVSIFILASLTVLIAIGINVWPIVTGLSVFGLAIGFGSQTLVKDIVSGLFFLIDDAFRLGEYVETSGAKGTVEKISIRSVSLRHARGALATVPYGQIGKVVNFSRDWVIEKLAFRVPFDTDVEKVRKLFKQVGQEIADDPELNKDLLEPFKSQGIAAVEDGTLVIRGKFKARAGQQFAVRKAVLTSLQRVFRENDIMVIPKFATPPTPVPK